jgi:ABC-type transport system substrate-binding protein
MIIEDAPAIFLFHSVYYQVVKPYIKGYILSPISTFPTLRFVSMDESYWE